MPRPAEDTERGQHDPGRQIGRRDPVAGGERRPEQRADEHRVEQGHERRVVARELARHQHEDGVGEHRAEGEADGGVHLGKARPHDDEDAEEADQDRHEAAPADPLAEHRPGEQRDDERREKDHGDRLVEAQILQREEVEGGRRDHQHGTHELLGQARGREQALDAEQTERRHKHEQQHELHDEAHPYDLRDGRPLAVARYLAEASRPENSTSAITIKPIAFRRRPASSPDHRGSSLHGLGERRRRPEPTHTAHPRRAGCKSRMPSVQRFRSLFGGVGGVAGRHEPISRRSSGTHEPQFALRVSEPIASADVASDVIAASMRLRPT